MKLPRSSLYTVIAAAFESATAQARRSDRHSSEARQSLQDVDFYHLSGEKIQDNTIMNFSALADFIPSLHIAEASVNTNIYMRGIGSGNNRGFEQSVGMYLDGVYLGRGRQYRSALLDVERVEVLRARRARCLERTR